MRLFRGAINMSNFIVSPNLLDIFYADAFVYNNYGCLVMGSGKSHFSTLTKSSGNVIEDFCCLSRKNNRLFTHFEPFIINQGYSPSSNIEINTFIFCLPENGTKQVFQKKSKVVLEVDYNSFFNASKFNICFTADPGSQLKKNTSAFIYKNFTDHNSRGLRFKNLTLNIKNAKFFIVPWMSSALDKSNLFKNTI